jgi:hypothetical protein
VKVKEQQKGDEMSKDANDVEQAQTSSREVVNA